MKFFFPDAQDMIYPGYDFINDEYPAHRVRQRDDRYAHEVLLPTPYDGMLLSKAIVDGVGKATGKYSQAQRDRLYRRGARKFFRLPDSLALLGDNGAFSYVDEDVPPVTVGEVLDFYELCGCDAGISVDHLILAFDANPTLFDADPDWIRRRDLTLELASQFLHEIRRRKSRVEPIGAAQGWSPQSYADSVRQLQEMGYDHVALGGMVPLKTRDILSTLRAVSGVLKPDTRLHLLGVARPESMNEFVEMGVTSFDSTSPFRQAFMDDRKNYHTPDSHYVAIRVPQIDGNARLKRRILAGDIDEPNAIRLEKACLTGLRAFDRGDATASSVLTDLRDYESLVEPSKSTYLQEYERMLDDRPWRRCGCQMCTRWGIDVAIFRGTERTNAEAFTTLRFLVSKFLAVPETRRSTNEHGPRTTRPPHPTKQPIRVCLRD